jgi:hypothetical protein
MWHRFVGSTGRCPVADVEITVTSFRVRSFPRNAPLNEPAHDHITLMVPDLYDLQTAVYEALCEERKWNRRPYLILLGGEMWVSLTQYSWRPDFECVVSRHLKPRDVQVICVADDEQVLSVGELHGR